MFRSTSAMVYIFIQMSCEMWDFDIYGKERIFFNHYLYLKSKSVISRDLSYWLHSQVIFTLRKLSMVSFRICLPNGKWVLTLSLTNSNIICTISLNMIMFFGIMGLSLLKCSHFSRRRIAAMRLQWCCSLVPSTLPNHWVSVSYLNRLGFMIWIIIIDYVSFFM